MALLTLEGGPGASGVGLILDNAPMFSQLLGIQYNLVGFDPRGVNNSGPVVDCFPGNSDARDAFENVFFSDVTDASSISLETQFYASEFFGAWCNEAIVHSKPSAQYISTPAVAEDMLTFAREVQKNAGKPEADAKVWYYGFSYGTVLGATFASLFPANVGRLILDGVVDAEDYYTNGWKTNLFQADEALNSFSTYCHESGPKNCSFWGPSPKNITDRLDNILAELKDNPIPVSGLSSDSAPALATYSDLKTLLLQSTYITLLEFPPLADALLELENGNSTALLSASAFLVTTDSDTMIRCIDSYTRNNLTTLQDYQSYVELLEGQSKYLGDTWPTNSNGILCRALKPNLPESMTFQGTLVSRY